MPESVYLTEARAVWDRIKALSAPDTLVFPIFTDPHLYTLTEPSAEALYKAMEALSSVLTADGILALGDNLGMLGRDFHTSHEEIAALITGLFDRIAPLWPCPLYAVNGNHDGYGTDFFLPEFWYSIAGTKYDRDTACRPGHAGYYYTDFPKAETRLVFLSLPSGSDLEAEMPTPLWKYGDDQLRWLAETALDTPYRVLLIAHVPLYYMHHQNMTDTLGVWTDTRAADSLIAALCGWIEDRDTAEEIFRAFEAHEPIRIPELGLDIPKRDYTRGLVACLSGHMHFDDFWLPWEERIEEESRDGRRNPLPCVQTVTCSTSANKVRKLTDEKGLGVYMDIAVLTPSRRELTLVRYGSGTDRTVPWPEATK